MGILLHTSTISIMSMLKLGWCLELNSVLIIIFIFFRAFSLFILGGLIASAVIHTVKCIFQKHNIDTIAYLTMIIIGIYIVFSWLVDLP